jgi:hypothetical protein
LKTSEYGTFPMIQCVPEILEIHSIPPRFGH